MKRTPIELSYLIQRQAIGCMGILLAFASYVVGLFGKYNFPQWYYSISATYYANSGPLMVGLLFASGVFLLTYVGYEIIDDVVNKVSGVAALGIVFFPCNTPGTPEYVGIFQVPVSVSGVLHTIFAALFFLSLAVNILVCFTRSKGTITKNKVRRNTLYYICGASILFFMVLEVVHSLAKWDGPVTMVLEAFMLLAFGVAWLVKGNTILKDK
jgi:hypothetical protein